jgi:Protein of unknown function (DUF1552)
MTFSRRDFAKLVGTGVVASALRGFEAQAQAMQIPRRVVLFFTPHGTVWNQWRPQGTVTTTNFTLNTILKPLEAFKSKLNLIEGLGLPPDGPGAPHTRGPAVLFTGSGLADDATFSRSDCSGGCSFGWNTSQSVDQLIATRLGNATPYGSLEFGVRSGGGFPGSHISYKAAAQPLPPLQDPGVAWQQLFAGRSNTDAQRARTLARRLNVLDAVNSDLNALQGKVSRADSVRLDAHASALSDLQRALTGSNAACTPLAKFPAKTTSATDWRPWAIDRHSELVAASLACGLTRVASVMFRPGENDGGSEGIYDWLGQTTEHHLSTHDSGADAQARLTAIYTWYAQRFAYLLQKLDAIPEDDGTMLDHTMVVWGTEIGEGATHDISNVPFVVAGGGKAGLPGNRYLRFPAGSRHNRLLVSMAHFMGQTDVSKFGLADTGSGPLTGLLA